MKRELEIINRLGLHARAAAKLVHVASGFDSRIRIVKDGQEVDGKSILGILLLAASQGSQIEIEAEGSDESEALDAIEKLINDRFDEDS